MAIRIKNLVNPKPTIKTFLEINNASILHETKTDGTKFMSLESVDGDWGTKSNYIDKIEYSNDVLEIFGIWCQRVTKERRL